MRLFKGMALSRAWALGVLFYLPLISFFERLAERLLVTDASNLIFLPAVFALFLFLVISIIGPPFIASRKGRRWWLWLIIALLAPGAVIAVVLAERPKTISSRC